MATKSIPQPLAGETAEQYHRRLINVGFIAEDKPSNTDKSPELLDRSRLQSLQDQLVATVPEKVAIGNKSIREKLATADQVWMTDIYWEVKQRCIDDGLLLPGRGRGGSVLRVTSRDQPEMEAGYSSPTLARLERSRTKQEIEPAAPQQNPLPPSETTAKDAIRVAFETGVKTFKEGDYATTLREWGGLAEQGIPVAQCNIGLMHSSGRGVEKNIEIALFWIEKAAAQGYARAQIKAGEMFEAGVDIAQDFVSAVRWYRKAAAIGNAEAQYLLAKMLSEGRGVDEDKKQALSWFQKSAEQGNISAAYELAKSNWMSGKEYIKWARKAAEQGHAGAQYLLYVGYSKGSSEFPKDGKEALKWLLQAAQNGDVYSQYHLGIAYCCGGVDEVFVLEENPVEAVRWLRLAANRGDLNAQETLESMYQPGDQLPEDPVQAFQWLLVAAEDGDCVAQFLVAERMMQGDGVPKNISEAAKWYETSAEQGYPWAQLALGHLYAEGKGVSQNYDSASRWYNAAIEQKKPEGVAGDIQGNVQEEAMYSLEKLESIKSKKQACEMSVVISPGGPMKMSWIISTGTKDSSVRVQNTDETAIEELRKASEEGNQAARNLLGIAYLSGEGVPFNMIAGQALFELAASAGNQDAAQNLIMSLSGGAKAEGVEKLAKQMSKPGKFLEALDKFVAYRESRRKPRKPKS